MVFLIIGVLYRTDIQLSRNWVSTIAPLCRCLLDKLRQNSIHIISKDTMQTRKTHYTRSYNVWHENALHLFHSVDMKRYIALGRTMWILEMMHCIRTYSVDFWGNTILGCIVRFLSLYCTRTYSTIFDFILHSDVQYDF